MEKIKNYKFKTDSWPCYKFRLKKLNIEELSKIKLRLYNTPEILFFGLSHFSGQTRG